MSLTTPTPQLASQAAVPPLITPAALADGGAARPAWRGGLEYGAASRWGSYHPENEDSYLLPEGARSPIAVADGVGGGARGKVASRVMTERVRLLTPALLADPAQLREWLLASDDLVAAEIARGAHRAGASTFVAAVPTWGGRRWAYTWAGDCRAYRLTASNDLQCLTRDDTYGNLAETPPEGAGPDDPARMVGNGAVDRANLGEVGLAEGEILFLCSDGVHRHVPAAQVVSILRAAGGLEQCCRRLAAAAHLNGGNDDATVVAVERRRWFGISHAPVWLAVVALTSLLAWQFLPHGNPPRPIPDRPVQPSVSPTVEPAPAAPAAAVPVTGVPTNTAPPVPASDALRLVPSKALKGGLQPADVAAPIKKQQLAPRHNASQLPEPRPLQVARPAKATGLTRSGAPPAESIPGGADATNGVQRADNPGADKIPAPPPATENQQ